MGPEDINELQLFEDIIRGQELRDEGIVSHDVALREFEQEIRERYVEKGFIAIPEEDLEALEEKMNEHWPYRGQVATVSGRLELIDDEDEDLVRSLFNDVAVPDATGEILHETGDETYCIDVDKVKLRSEGVIIDVLLDDDGKLDDVRIGYCFYRLDDREGELALFAQPHMIDTHTYDVPTPAEARARLERNWSSQLEMIDSAVRSNETLPHRLVAIANMLSDELKDATFRELVELYLNEELSLDMDMPYMASVRSHIDSLDDINNDNGTWRPLEIEGELTIFLNEPEIRFNGVTDESDKTPQAYLFGMTFNDAYGDKPEVVAIPVLNIDRFFSTRARTSLAERAIESMDRQVDKDMQAIMKHKNVVKFAETQQDTDDRPEYIQQLEELEEAMDRIRKLSDEYLMHSFTTYEDAKRDAKSLLEKIREQLNGTVYFSGAHQVEVMGERVKLANLRYNLHFDEEQNVLMHGADKENPIVELPFGDRVTGKTAELYPVAESTLVDIEAGDGVVFYTPRVVMSVVISEGVGLAIDSEPPLSQLLARNQAAVPLDSSSDIQFISLKQYRASREAVERAKKAYGDASSFMHNVYQLEAALNTENPNDFKVLDESIISGLVTGMDEARRREESTAPAVAVLEALLGDRNILAVSDVFSKSGEGEYTLDTDSSGTLHGWRVIDIQQNTKGDDTLLFVQASRSEDYRYISMSSITELRF